jgi:hypothetical protein
MFATSEIASSLALGMMASLECVFMQNAALWNLGYGWFVRLEDHWLKGHAN